MYLRDDQPGETSRSEGNGSARPRLNLLLSYSGWQTNPVEQLPRLLAPMGIQSYLVTSGDEATDLIRHIPIHIAVVDLGIPLNKAADEQPGEPGGPRILQMLRRLEQPPPTVVIRPPQPTVRESARTLQEALREGAFAVLDRPLRMETMLETMRRVLRRHYADNWPRDRGKPHSN